MGIEKQPMLFFASSLTFDEALDLLVRRTWTASAHMCISVS